MKRREKVQVIVFRKKESPETGQDTPLPYYEFLVLKTNDSRGGFWQPVTGRTEMDDTDRESAARRELEEETGIHVTEKLFKLDCTFDFVKGETSFREHVFAARVGEETTVRLSEEHQDSRWCSHAQARELLKFDSNRHCLGVLGERLGGPAVASLPADLHDDPPSIHHGRLAGSGETGATRLNLPLVALSFTLLLVLGVAMSLFEEAPNTSFQGELIIDFNGENSRYLNDSYDLNNGFNIFVWERTDGNWSFSVITAENANREFGLELDEPEGEFHVILIFRDLNKKNASVLDLLTLAAEIDGFELEASYSKTLDATRVTAIAGVKDGEGLYWQYWVDEDYATVAADNNFPEGEHTVKWVIG